MAVGMPKESSGAIYLTWLEEEKANIKKKKKGLQKSQTFRSTLLFTCFLKLG